jgi:hypothetical protein
MKFGMLTALRMIGYRERSGGSRVALWTCRCECGRELKVLSNNLLTGNTRSCGCKRESHGRGGTNIYSTWSKMISRCHNEKDKVFRYYGARGIHVCERWRKSFKAFLEDMGDKPDARLTLDRIDNSGPYSKGNCRWATMSEQRRNSRQAVIWIENAGERLPLSEWSTRTGICYHTLYRRHLNGWPIDKLLFLPPVRGRNQSSGHR